MSELPGRDAVRAFGLTRAEFWKAPPRGVCAVDACPEENPILYTRADGLMTCAGHYRQLSVRGGSYPCDVCGAEGAFRDPLPRLDEMLCLSCHEKLRGYIPTERSMISVIEKREGFTHSQGTRAKCILADKSTDCAGQIKPRGKKGVMCDKHNDPKKWMKGVQ